MLFRSMVQDYEYGNDKNAKSGSRAMMPTRSLLELYNENIDARYNAWFREEYKPVSYTHLSR